jgi:hypothetical protein
MADGRKAWGVNVMRRDANVLDLPSGRATFWTVVAGCGFDAS